MSEKDHGGGHATQVNARYALVIMLLGLGICLTTVFGVRYLHLHEEAQAAARWSAK